LPTVLALTFLSSATLYALPSPSALAQNPPAAPAPKQLNGTDAQRVEELNKTIDQLRRAGKFEDAVAYAKKVIMICEREVGADHWKAASASWDVADLRRIAALPEEGRKALASLGELEDRANTARSRTRYAEAEALAWIPTGPKTSNTATPLTNKP